MNPKQPETADHDLAELRRKLQSQRAAKADALQKVKRTTMQAVRCYDTPTTYLDPEKLREKLAEDDGQDSSSEDDSGQE